MLQKILVALDHSDSALQVFEMAIALAKSMAGNLMLLHVLSPNDEASPHLPIMGDSPAYLSGMTNGIFEAYQDQWQKYEAKGLGLLRSYTETALAAGVKAEFTQNVGSPDRLICELAKNLNSDLIVLGRRGHSGLGELMLGSVSNYVLHHAPCSIFIVHAPTPAMTPSVAKA